jgi:hypothetical protein
MQSGEHFNGSPVGARESGEAGGLRGNRLVAQEGRAASRRMGMRADGLLERLSGWLGGIEGS